MPPPLSSQKNKKEFLYRERYDSSHTLNNRFDISLKKKKQVKRKKNNPLNNSLISFLTERMKDSNRKRDRSVDTLPVFRNFSVANDILFTNKCPWQQVHFTERMLDEVFGAYRLDNASSFQFWAERLNALP